MKEVLIKKAVVRENKRVLSSQNQKAALSSARTELKNKR